MPKSREEEIMFLMRVVTLCVLLLMPCLLQAKAAKKVNNDDLNDPTKVDADFAVQGEYVGEATLAPGKTKTGVQVIARGGGSFEAVFYAGGLPGEGWMRGDPRTKAAGMTQDGVTSFQAPELSAKIKDGTMTLANAAGKELGQLKRIIRKSPTLGLKPPEGAVVLFDGKNTDQFEKGRMTEDGLLKEGAISKYKFQDATIHLEFRTPYKPKAKGQGRGNSGFYFQGRYEVQVLDSFGLEGRQNEAGGIYSVGPPIVNMCYPPLSWQTYDVEFTAAKYEDGKKVKNARITVKHNGVVVQKDTEVDHATTASKWKEGPEPGPLYIQNHGNPVRFRNIWVLPKK